MPSILLIGGNGSLARHATSIFISKGNAVHSVIRNGDQVPHLRGLGANPIVHQIAVIWSAGAGGPGANPERLKAVDTDGHIKVMDAISQAANEAGTTRRFISVSSLEVRDNVNRPMPYWYNDADQEFSRWLWPSFGPYFRARLESDMSLVRDNNRRNLDYTIVRPGWMHSGNGKGTIGAGRCKISGQISREDVARVLELCVARRETIGLAFDVASGNTPIEEAVVQAADSFEGYH